MTARILDGREVSARMCAEMGDIVAGRFPVGHGPRICVILVGENPASRSYVRTKCRTAEKLGFRHDVYHFDEGVSQAEVEARIDACNADPDCDAVFVQLPLPRHLDAVALTGRVLPEKDADGLTRYAAGALARGENGALMPCTPRGIMYMLGYYGINPSGMDAVVIGRSNIVGKPMAMMLLAADATVTICHRHTVDLEDHVRRADLIVAAAGSPGLVRGEWVKPGAVVVDCGFTKTPDGVIHGDVDFVSASERASFITPVPGGVGPMTVVTLMRQTLDAALRKL